MKRPVGVTVGVKELKDKLTHFLTIAREGGKVIVTDRGKPVAVVASLAAGAGVASPDERLAKLAHSGRVILPSLKGPHPRVNRAKVKGIPVSQTVIEERK